MNSAITYKDLSLSFAKILSVEEIQITECPNEHSVLYLTAVLDSMKEQTVFYEIPETITLYYHEDNNQKILFKGILSHSDMKRRGKYLYLSLEAKGLTYLMDMSRKIHSYQDITETNSQIIDEIAGRYPGCSCIKNLDIAATNQLFLQYEESDWEFLKRFANHYQVMLYPDSLTEQMNIRVGVSATQEDMTLHEEFYTVEKSFMEFETSKSSALPSLLHQQYMNYVAESYQFMPIGSCIKFKGNNWYVKSAARVLENGLLVNRYTLVQKEESQKPLYFNGYLPGISLPGKITDIKRNEVQVLIKNDLNKKNSQTYWFPYSTVAGSSDGSGWYCMPEKGDMVRIYFPTRDEREAYVVSCSGGPASKGQPAMNPNVRNIKTAQGNVVEFTSEGAVLQVKNGAACIALNKSGEIGITAAESISFFAGEKFIMEAESISIEGKETVDLENDAGSKVSVKQTQIDIKAVKIYEN